MKEVKDVKNTKAEKSGKMARVSTTLLFKFSISLTSLQLIDEKKGAGARA